MWREFCRIFSDPQDKGSKISGKSKWGLSKWGLKATLCNLRTIVHNCALLWLFGALSKGIFRHKMTTIVGNRGQLWTSALSPHLESPHLDFPENCGDIFGAFFLRNIGYF